jgi:hypothetical protein
MFGIDQQVQQTADAYRSKPQMLQQKYAQNQQLIDLLALQKLKSDKEEASRQMALSMQGKPPTIADQRESQVLDMTKKEVIDEQAGVMQNKMKQMQDAQKKVLQAAGAPQMPGQSTPQPQQPPSAGLAGLPAPNIQGMAGGGIVAFSGSTADGSYVDPLAEATGMSSESLARDRERTERILAEREAEKEAIRQAFLRQAAPQLARQEPAAPQSQATAPPQEEPPAPAPRAAPQGTGGGAPMGNTPGTVGFGIQSLIGTKTPEEAARENEARAAAAANYTPEERAGKQRIIDERTAAYDRNKLNRMLMAMAGQTSNYGAIAAGGAQAENDADQAMRERQRGEGQLIDIGPESRKAGTKAGEARFKDVVAGMSQGVDAAVKQAQIASAAADRQLAREGMDYNRAATTMATLTGRITTAKKDINDAYIKSINGLFIPAGQKPNNAQQQAIDVIETTRRLGLAELEALVGPQLLAAEKKMSIPSTDGFSLIGVRPNTPPKS